MKKIFLIAVLGVLTLASCKKDYSCSCTYTYSGPFGSNTTIYTKTIQEASKKQASYACVEAKITEVDGDYTSTEECKLSK